MAEDTTGVGAVLRRIRKARKLSQETVAFESGLNRSHISQIERGVQDPNISTLLKLARALEVSPVTIMALVEEPLDTDKTTNRPGQSLPHSYPNKLEGELQLLLDLLSPESRPPFLRFIRAHWEKAYRKGSRDGQDQIKRALQMNIKTIEHHLSSLAQELNAAEDP